MAMTKLDILNVLAGENGADCWYAYGRTPYSYTSGVKNMADMCGAYWLIDWIMSYQLPTKKLPDMPLFQVWKFAKIIDDDSPYKFTVTMDDEELSGPLITEKGGNTEFPLDEIKLFFVDGTLLLTSEY